MGIVSTAAGQNFIHEFSSLTGTAFQKKCYEYLNELIPELRYAADLKKVDRKGIDIYQLSTSPKFNYDIAFQCKGFEERFDQSQYDLCLDSISALRRSGRIINQYYMIINLKLKYFDLALKKKLVNVLNLLVKDGTAKAVFLLEAEGFTTYISRLIIKKMYTQIDVANKRFAKDYIHSMNQKFYYEKVPYSIGPRHGINPTDFVIDKIITRDNNAVKSYKKNWFFIISEFGFGKTSLLFHLFKKIKSGKQRFIYLPASLFQKDDFQYTSNFGNQTLKIIEGEEIDFRNNFNKLRSKLINYLLQYEDNRTVLMIDGLDEHEELFKQDVLRGFFKNMSSFRCPIIFTIRKEMWEERYGTFEAALGKSNEKNKVKLYLNEWEDEDLLSFIDVYSQKNSSNSSWTVNINAFRNLVENKMYKKYYGDIPKRPLFLEMLISDIRFNKIKKRNISEIYIIYLKNKFLIDRQGSFFSHNTRRPLSISEDVNKTLGLIFTVLTRVAAKMVIGIDKGNTVVLSSYIEEQQLESILSEGGIPKTIELMLNSVLVPFGIRMNNNLSLKFAHRSFQEFFLARAIFNHISYCLSNNENITDLNIVHSEGVNQFLDGFLKTEADKRELKKIKANIKEYYPIIYDNTVAAFIVRP